MRGERDGVELEELLRGLGRRGRLRGVDVEGGARDPPLGQRRVQGLLVDEAAAGGVDDVQGRLGERELLGADEADGLRGAGHVDGQDVRGGHQLGQVHHAGAELGGAGLGDVGVVGQQVHAEGAQTLGDELADAAEADDSDGLVQQLGAVQRLALPLAGFHGGVGAADVAQAREDQGDGELGGRDDVRGRRVDDHGTGRGRGGHVHVVQAHAGAGDDREAARGGEDLRVDLRGRADEQRVGLGDGLEEGGAVGAVHVPHLHVGSEHLDGGGRELFGDQDDGTGHAGPPARAVQVGVCVTRGSASRARIQPSHGPAMRSSWSQAEMRTARTACSGPGGRQGCGLSGPRSPRCSRRPGHPGTTRTSCAARGRPSRSGGRPPSRAAPGTRPRPCPGPR